MEIRPWAQPRNKTKHRFLGRGAVPQGLFPNAMCATQAHGLRPVPQGKNACAGLPQACARAVATSVHAVGYPWGRRLQSCDRSKSRRQSCRKDPRRVGRIYIVGYIYIVAYADIPERGSHVGSRRYHGSAGPGCCVAPYGWRIVGTSPLSWQHTCQSLQDGSAKLSAPRGRTVTTTERGLKVVR